MPPFKLPFTSRRQPASNGTVSGDGCADHQASTSPYGSDKPSLALGVKEKREEPNEFKLSSVNDSGKYLPPSPTEQHHAFWGKSPSTSTTTHRSIFDENEPFSISRESFDSYRRSFDISGRSPIVHQDSFTSRCSFDSRHAMSPRPVLNGSTFEAPLPKQPEEFEEVGLNDEVAKPKKKGFLSRFQDQNGTTGDDGKHHFNLLSGRKRGQSGSGSELRSIDRPSSKGNQETTVKS